MCASVRKKLLHARTRITMVICKYKVRIVSVVTRTVNKTNNSRSRDRIKSKSRSLGSKEQSLETGVGIKFVYESGRIKWSHSFIFVGFSY